MKVARLTLLTRYTRFTQFSFAFPALSPYTSSPVMPKLKSHSGAKKRFRKTGSGKVAFKRHSRNHLLQQKAKRQKRLNRTHMLHPRDERNLMLLLPNL